MPVTRSVGVGGGDEAEVPIGGTAEDGMHRVILRESFGVRRAPVDSRASADLAGGSPAAR
jgi:hypothetical protein